MRFELDFFSPDAGSSAHFTAMPNQLMSSPLWLHETGAALNLFSHRVRKFPEKLKTSSASQLLGFLDPEKKLFSHRILSRDECIDPFSKTGNLRWVLWNMENISIVNHSWHYHLGTFHLSTRLQQSQSCSDLVYTVCQNVEAVTCKSLNLYQTFGCSYLTHPVCPNRNLFPCGDSMVCIIDDREDVWKFAPNLVTVKKYVYFQGTGDINAPPGSREVQTARKGTVVTHTRQLMCSSLPRSCEDSADLCVQAASVNHVWKSMEPMSWPLSASLGQTQTCQSLVGGVLIIRAGSKLLRSSQCVFSGLHPLSKFTPTLWMRHPLLITQAARALCWQLSYL